MTNPNKSRKVDNSAEKRTTMRGSSLLDSLTDWERVQVMSVIKRLKLDANDARDVQKAINLVLGGKTNGTSE